MESVLLLLTLGLMFSGGWSGSESMSCSMVNGKMICNRQTSSGNTAMSSSHAASGPNYEHQSTYAGAGNPGQWESSSQTASGGSSGGYTYSSSNSDNSGPRAPPGAFGGSLSGYSHTPSSDVPPNNDIADTEPEARGFGGLPGGVSYTYSSTSNHDYSTGPSAAVGGFGFASAGSFPSQIFPGFGYPPRGSPGPSGGSPPFQGPPQPWNPFDFVNGFMGGGFPGAGGFAGAGGAGGGGFAFAGRR